MGRVAARADSGYMDLFCRNAGVLKENAVGGTEIQLPVHPVLFPVRIREDLRSLLRGKGAPEALRHIFPDLITFPADAGAHHCGQILRTGPEFLSHPPDRMSGDLSDGPAPACVQKRDGSVHRICQIDRQAVRMEGGQRDSPGVGEKTVDVIIGPLGIIIAESMLGEITPAMATALSSADAVRVLIPMNRTQCENYVVGVRDNSLTALLDEAADTVVRLTEGGAS